VKINLLFIYFSFLSTVTFSQANVTDEMKNSIPTPIGKFPIQKVFELIDYYKNAQIEILTLDLEINTFSKRKMFVDKIAFGQTYVSSDGNYILGNIVFEKKKPIVNEINEKYTCMTIGIDRKNLYQILIDISKNSSYKLIDQKQWYGGYSKYFEYSSPNSSRVLFINTYDGDDNSYVSIMLK
jgi:hypothetical protein